MDRCQRRTSEGRVMEIKGQEDFEKEGAVKSVKCSRADAEEDGIKDFLFGQEEIV